MFLADFPPVALRIFAALLGLVWGSFLNVVIYRVPREMSIVRPPSHCPSCSAPIVAYRNVPVFGWLALRGRAACCGARISARYPLVEAAGKSDRYRQTQRLVLVVGPPITTIVMPVTTCP